MAVKYKVVESGSHPSEGDLQNEYKKGYVLVSVTSLYWPTYNSSDRKFWATYAYTGGRRMSAQA